MMTALGSTDGGDNCGGDTAVPDVAAAAAATTRAAAATAVAFADYKSAVQRGNVRAAVAAFSDSAPSIVCVPSGAAAFGSVASITSFLKTMAVQHSRSEYHEEVLMSIATSSNCVEESIVTISLHMHWDQGTVLRQIGALPNSVFCKANKSETVLPVLGPKVVDRLKEEQAALLLAKPIASVPPPPMRSEQENAPREPGNSPKILVPNRPGGPTHDIFGTEGQHAGPEPVKTGKAILAHSQQPHTNPIVSDEPPPKVRTSVPVDPRRYEQHINVVGGENGVGAAAAAADAVERPSTAGRRDPNWSVVAAAGSDASVGTRHGKKMVSGMRTNMESGEDLNGAETDSAASEDPVGTSLTGRRMKSYASSAMASSLVLGDDGGHNIEEELKAPRSGLGGRRDHNAPSKATVERPSSKFSRPPGGSSSITFG
ncbi:hypothetical protein DFJ73DRAFT_776517 [Zopfochytrium polystomum]|nr:hypothetical protein DFJ73DRAFT_776517 [Zopfochytrium polystomum]